jgi:hypothetical protein
MKMSVIFANGEVGTVPKYILDHAIREKKIIAFLRSSGWVQIDRDPVRKEQSAFTGSGKRDGDFSGLLSSGDPPTG